MKRLLIILLILLLYKIGNTQIITTVAGNGSKSYFGDSGPATLAALNWPTGVTLDLLGNLYIADMDNIRIRKVRPDGIINTIAGIGIYGFGGDDSLATLAKFTELGYIKIGYDSCLYVPDVFNNRIRKINNLGIISTILGGDSIGCSGDGGLTSNARIAGPVGINFDKYGNLYFCDASCRIRKVSLSDTITRVAGSDSLGGYSGNGGLATNAVLNNPVDIAIDYDGNVYITDLLNNVIRKVDTFGIITTIAGIDTFGYGGDEGPATLAILNCPEGIITDGAGNIFFSDECNMRVRRIDHVTNIITTVAGNGIEGFSGDNGLATAAKLDVPAGLAFDRDGNLYIADAYNNRIRKVTNAGVPLKERFAESVERRDGILVFPNPAGKEVTIVGAKNCEVWVYNIVGSKMYNTYIADNKHIIDIGLFAKGFYFVEVVNVETGLKVVNKILKE